MPAILPALKRILFVSALFLTGAVFGPLLFAALAAFSPEQGPFGESIEAEKLVGAYRDELPEQILWLTIMPPNLEKQCGYETDSVFDPSLPRDQRETHMLDYAAYLTLSRWRNEHADYEWISRITEKIDSSFSDYHKSFLRRCIESTLFKPHCMAVVEEFGNKIGRFPERDGPESANGPILDRVVCNFVDGVAARKGIELQTADRSE
ncbi:hypothetical protein [Parasphingorhabdus sp.]|uniref:hypothetical protein n=1 Tax=Parasphingorhabdus sp. TaxID=2709688 RepID=UPI0035939D47